MTEIKNAWDRLPDESDRAYRAFSDYKNMGHGRSLDSLLTEYRGQAANKDPIRPPTLRRNTLAGWSYKNNWPLRAKKWDEHLINTENAQLTLTASSLMSQEIEDYERQRNEWLQVYEQTAMFKQTVTAIEDDPESPGNKIKVITVRLNTSDWLRLSRWRDSISMQGRRALGLPERITKQEYEAGESINDSLDSARQLLESLITRNLNPARPPDIPE